ncbi:MAG: hypothetical protein KC441_12220 [Anaerolineales bacterium]|nr:hypothetical protein [Anaerolineales bacterium]MCA9943402.1 hypothetical protein [Anaerolineales bacterium]
MSQEYFISATIQCDTALHIGIGSGHDAADSPIRRAADGTIHIPGRAVTGSLRTLATRLAPRLGMMPCDALLTSDEIDDRTETRKVKSESSDGGLPCGCPVCVLFGDVNPVDNVWERENGAVVESKASALWVYDATLLPPDKNANGQNPSGPATYVRDGVGIDRRTRTAAANVKFDYELVPANTQFALRLRLALDEADETAVILLTAALNEWQAGRGQLGGNVARGLGRFRLLNMTCGQTTIQTADDLYHYLLADDQVTQAQPLPGWPNQQLQAARAIRVDRSEEGRERSVLGLYCCVNFKLRFTDLFLANDPVTALLSDFDHAPLVEFMTFAGAGPAIISGSSLRGVMRSRAEKIARTLATAHWHQADNPKHAFDNYVMRCPACDVVNSQDGSPLASCDSRLNIPTTKEAPEEVFCLSCHLFGSQRRGSRLWVQDAPLDDQKLDTSDWQAQDFLAIDRFTGGGLHGAKFDAAPLVKARFKASLTLHDPLPWELGWLALLLRDLADGQVSLGFGSAKGYGRVQATHFNWEIGFITPADLKCKEGVCFPDSVKANAVPSGLYDLATAVSAEGNWLPTDWQTVAQTWVDAFKNKVHSYETHAKLERMQADSFFTEDGRFAKQFGPARAEVNNG